MSTSTSTTTSTNTAFLIQYVIKSLTPDSVPEAVWLRIEDLFLDWLGSTLSSRGTHPIPIFETTAKYMGPKDGTAQVFASGSTSSPYWAAWTNAASSHTLEQDDVHNGSVMHPATVVFPAVLAAAQDNHKTGPEMLLASIAGYEVGVRIAESMGRSHYQTFHTTSTMGTIAAAVAVGKLLNLDYEQMLSALGTAGAQASGIWAFMRSGAGDTKQLHSAHAAANGLLSAYMARDGLKGAPDIIEGPGGLMKSLARDDVDATRLTDGLGERWAVLETSFKYHACCRHTHPAADALLDAIEKHGIKDPMTGIKGVVAHVHQVALDVLGPVDAAPPPKTVHTAKFSMKSTLALIALRRSAGLVDFKELALTDPSVLEFRDRVSMVLDPVVDEAYPKQWLGRVQVELNDGRVVGGACDEPKGDPGNTLSRPELEDKFRRLVSYPGTSPACETEKIIAWCWALREGSRAGQSCAVPGITS
ncbi:hypothetical protein VMCG_10196 [Cytospora schulzeri]|uniref:MmgE/PrpD family protein n=1 Tax=Cytospora schulzeri TaxID=448051 RepID=A0A423VDK1_9PEZI|nr:hypothetical protein VMCG_10196 [Valsa malicola]